MLKNTFVREEIYPKLFYNSFVSDKYKSNHISINLFMPLEFSTVSDFALLSGVISKSCEKYKNYMELSKRLSELYGASLSSDVIKIGEIQGVTLHLTFIPEKYTIDNEKICKQAVDLLLEILLSPNIDENGFDESDTEIEKARLIDLIESDINDKRRYAVTNCLKNMCKDEPYSIPKYGYKDRVKEIKRDGLYNSYLNLLKKSRIEIFYVGVDDPGEIKEEVESHFASVERDPIGEIRTIINDKVDTVSDLTETMDVSQSKLVMGFKAGQEKSDRQNVAMMMAMLIYGITPASKLFLNVRERLSLCYYCSVQYDRHKCILFVDSGIEKDKKDEAIKEILLQLDKMKSGDFTDDEIKSALSFYVNGYKGLYDSPGSVQAFYLGNVMSGINLNPAELIEIAESISREDIVEVCRDITLDTIYFLTGDNK